jgi:hypothetical protein
MRWTTKDEDKPTKRVEAKCDGSEEEEDEGYNLDRGWDLLSKTWSREERERQTRNNNGSDVEQANEGEMGYKDGKDNDLEESEDERKRKDRGQRNVGSPAKETRSHTARRV